MSPPQSTWIVATDGRVFSWVPKSDFVLRYTVSAFMWHCEGSPVDANDAAPEAWLPCDQFGSRREFVQWCALNRPRIELPRLGQRRMW